MAAIHSIRQQEDLALAKPRILVIDDSRMMRKAISRLLADKFDILVADDGDIGWEFISDDEAIQVVFADLMMPNTNGFELLRQIRASSDPRISQLPVIIITGHEDDEKIKQQAIALGATDFISKPFDSVQLIARAQAHAKHHDTTRQLHSARKTLTEESTIDPLTGAANARYFQQHGPELLAFAVRQHSPLSVLRIDIDRFDALVQRQGQQIANKVLVNVSRTIGACVREEDNLARIGTAKFALMMPGADEGRARAVAGRIVQLIYKTVYRLGDTRFRISASAGVVTRRQEESANFQTVVHLAEDRLRAAISQGGNRLVIREQAAADHETRTIAPKPLTIDEAVMLLRVGQAGRVAQQLPSLLAKVYPVLVFGNNHLKLGLDDGLARLREKLTGRPGS
ncbi:MAG: GGDEF domain-containing response regulator [Gammaproteobacteria bacterium]